MGEGGREVDAQLQVSRRRKLHFDQSRYHARANDCRKNPDWIWMPLRHAAFAEIISHRRLQAQPPEIGELIGIQTAGKLVHCLVLHFRLHFFCNSVDCDVCLKVFKPMFNPSRDIYCVSIWLSPLTFNGNKRFMASDAEVRAQSLAKGFFCDVTFVLTSLAKGGVRTCDTSKVTATT